MNMIRQWVLNLPAKSIRIQVALSPSLALSTQFIFTRLKVRLVPSGLVQLPTENPAIFQVPWVSGTTASRLQQADYALSGAHWPYLDPISPPILAMQRLLCKCVADINV